MNSQSVTQNNSDGNSREDIMEGKTAAEDMETLESERKAEEVTDQ
jgi:hypothetical protein